MVLRKTSFNQFVEMAGASDVVIVGITLALTLTPDQCVTALENDYLSIALLDGYCDSKEHYTFIGFLPTLRLITTNGSTVIEENNQTRTTNDDPFNSIKELQQKIQPAYFDPASRLTGAAIGVLGYGAIRHIEAIPKKTPQQLNVPDIEVNFFSFGIYFDYAKNEITITKLVSHSLLDGDYKSAIADIETIIRKISAPSPVTANTVKTNNDTIHIDLSDEAFAEKIALAQKHIRQGDIFQIVLSRTFQKTFNVPPLKLYQYLKKHNPSPYHFYFKNKEYTLVGASPEKIIRIKDNIITSTPLAGTRPKNGKIINAIIQELMNDSKERAEHLMLVDLARNDVGRIATPGSIKVTRLAYPLILKNIIHIASDVSGELAIDFDPLDALIASFPAGTLSGAPKVRAMQLIDDLEISERGFYGGCVFAIDHTNDLDTCIIIRSALIKDNTIYVRAGCGVVYDSVPELEAAETRHKAKSMLEAIHYCETKESLC